jgi:U1 small nuclear ribonucleoprotein of 70kDa MW N terminal
VSKITPHLPLCLAACCSFDFLEVSRVTDKLSKPTDALQVIDCWFLLSRRNPGVAAKLETERRMKEGISGHKTGLPKKLLELFAPRPQPEYKPAIRKRKAALPYTGIAQFVDQFASPGEAEYEPPPPADRPPSPRLFRNPEMAAQARVDKELKAEK